MDSEEVRARDLRGHLAGDGAAEGGVSGGVRRIAGVQAAAADLPA
jgi:hypothetical protein